jgi:hypothetical protein
MTMKIVRSKEEFIEVASEEMFDDLRETLHELDDQATAAGIDDPEILVQMSANLAVAMASYAVYLATGMASSGDQSDKKDEALASYLATLHGRITKAMTIGMERAVRVANKIKKDAKIAEADTDALLKKVVKTWKS